MDPITYIDRRTQKKESERVYGEKWLKLFYDENMLSHFFVTLIAVIPLFSIIYGWIQRMPFTKKKISPFIAKYKVDESEFLKKTEEFSSFNDFFCRKLKPEVRPLAEGAERAIIPADGRFLCYQNIEECDGFVVKGKKFFLKELLQDERLAYKYEKGAMLIGRLCPSDYHRFHFPLDCYAEEPRLINGPLFSVNPIAIKQNINRLSENKRVLTELTTEQFGKIIFIEVGATFVGSIRQTFNSKNYYNKGAEKGFFSFGGSSIILLFEQNRIVFDTDLILNSLEHIETLCLMGQSLGTKT